MTTHDQIIDAALDAMWERGGLALDTFVGAAHDVMEHVEKEGRADDRRLVAAIATDMSTRYDAGSLAALCALALVRLARQERNREYAAGRSA